MPLSDSARAALAAASPTAGTASASGFVVLDANKALDTIRTADLRIGTSGSETALTATGTEINRTCDVSGRLVAGGGTLSATEASHDGKIIKWDTAAGTVVTLPAATGSGARILLMVTVLATSNSHIVKVANSSDIMQGVISTIDTDTAGTITGWATAADSDTVTLNRSTTGSAMRGEWVELIDAATNLWLVRGQLSNTGSGATPFSATV